MGVFPFRWLPDAEGDYQHCLLWPSTLTLYYLRDTVTGPVRRQLKETVARRQSSVAREMKTALCELWRLCICTESARPNRRIHHSAGRVSGE